jgi:hypothetical protein
MEICLVKILPQVIGEIVLFFSVNHKAEVARGRTCFSKKGGSAGL